MFLNQLAMNSTKVTILTYNLSAIWPAISRRPAHAANRRRSQVRESSESFLIDTSLSLMNAGRPRYSDHNLELQ